jgi:DNA topoisomerase-2
MFQTETEGRGQPCANDWVLRGVRDGEALFQATIIGMAQDFVGSNNVNLLATQGQFGTRLAGGKDAAPPRYIFTHLTPFVQLLLPEDDDVVLEYRTDDDQTSTR